MEKFAYMVIKKGRHLNLILLLDGRLMTEPAMAEVEAWEISQACGGGEIEKIERSL
jgi:hypothetical protein